MTNEIRERLSDLYFWNYNASEQDILAYIDFRVRATIDNAIHLSLKKWN